MTHQGQATNAISSVQRAADVLKILAESVEPTQGVTEISQALGLSKATVHRTLASLKATGLVEVDELTRRYQLGPAALTLGLKYLARLDVRAMAAAAMRRLMAATHETATLSIRHGWTRLYVDQVTPPLEVKMTVSLGEPFPLHAGASSKAFLAFISPEERERYLQNAPLQKLTSATVTDVLSLRAELSAIRDRGYAVSAGERQSGASSIAAPIVGRDHEPLAVISVCGPLERMRDRVPEIAALLLEETEGISQRLGQARPSKS